MIWTLYVSLNVIALGMYLFTNLYVYRLVMRLMRQIMAVTNKFSVQSFRR